MMGELKKITAQSAGLNGGAFIPPNLPGSGRGLPVQFVVGSIEDPDKVAAVANEVLAKALATRKFYYGDTDLKFDQPQTDIYIDREKAGRLGIKMSEIGGNLGTLLGGAYVNRFAIEGRSYKVIPQVSRKWRLDPKQLESYYIRTASGQEVPLSTVVKLKQSVQPSALPRFQQLNAATISLLPAAGVSLGDAKDILDQIAAETFPQGYTSDYAGQLRQYVTEGSSLIGTFALAIIVIFLVLAALYESFRDPFIVLMTVPLAITGAMIFIFLGATTINIYTQVGLITLVGLISKHGILMVEFANQLRETKGLSKREAIEEAAAVRLRPILMTAFAMVAGVIPLLFAQGPGAMSRFSIGVVLTCGMSIGTLFTLFVVPAFYLLVSKEHRTLVEGPQEE
jgi:multidrug efflux pump